jgi:hypothetical protein
MSVVVVSVVMLNIVNTECHNALYCCAEFYCIGSCYVKWHNGMCHFHLFSVTMSVAVMLSVVLNVIGPCCAECHNLGVLLC